MVYINQYGWFEIMGQGAKETILTPALCRAARGLLDWTQADLAEHAAVSRSTTTKGGTTKSTAPRRRSFASPSRKAASSSWKSRVSAHASACRRAENEPYVCGARQAGETL
jgi:hypothetical protein